MPTTKALITQSLLTDIADAIRAKNGSTDEYTPGGMATAIAALPTGAPAGQICRYYIDENGMAIEIGSTATSSMPTKQNLVFSGLRSIKSSALRAAFQQCSGVGSVTFPDLVSGSTSGSALREAFNTSSITECHFPVLETATARTFQNAFQSSNYLNTVDFPVLKTAQTYAFSYAFASCNGLTAVAFPLLESVDTYGFEHGFYSAINIESVSFPKLKTIAANAFTYCFNGLKKLPSISFPSLETIASSAFGANAFGGCNLLTEFHFPVAVQSQVEATSNYSTLWGRGAGNATVYFDL